MDKSELVKQLFDASIEYHLYIGNTLGDEQKIFLRGYCKYIADFIIADRLRIVESLIKYKQGFTDFSPYAGCHKAINETLNLAGVNNDKTN